MNGLFMRSVTARNYKSIAACKVDLGPLMFLVGPNAAGKSNFLDMLRFVSEALRTSLDHALRERGTIKEVRRRSGGHPNHFSLRFDFTLPDGQVGHYAFRIGAKQGGGYEVQNEECKITEREALGGEHFFSVRSGKVQKSSAELLPPALPDRLFLVNAAGLPQFRPIFDALSRIEVYNLNPKEISRLQKPDPGEILRRDGGNAASILQKFPAEVKNRLVSDLSRIVPGIADVEARTLGNQETIEFRQIVHGQNSSWRFPAESMSDGTLRAFGVLLSIFQATIRDGQQKPPLLIGLEEPEVALHPAASSTLLSALRQGARHCQILVTSHSPDLLDNPDISPESLLSVDNAEGMTRIAPIDQASKEILRDRLMTAGELLRQSQLAPAKDALSDVTNDRQLRLFDYGER